MQSRYEIYEVKNEDDGTVRTFHIRRMTPFAAIAILKELLTRAMPINLLEAMDMLGNEDETKSTYESLLNLTSSAKPTMSMEEFEDLQKKIIGYVDEELKGTTVKVIDEYGNFNVPDLEYDLTLYMKLVIRVIVVNYKDFFIGVLRNFHLISPMNQSPEESQEG